MREFFKPWQRKIGVVTLGLACVLMVGWARSFVIADRIKLRRGDGGIASQISSFRGNLDWEYVRSGDLKKLTPLVFGRYASAFLAIVNRDKQRTILWTWNCCGVGRGECHSIVFEQIVQANPDEHLDVFQFTIWRISYWYLISPLTLLSAYLLRSKPRPQAPKQTNEPAPTTGT